MAQDTGNVRGGTVADGEAIMLSAAKTIAMVQSMNPPSDSGDKK
jgi:hypothetical protein